MITITQRNACGGGLCRLTLFLNVNVLTNPPLILQYSGFYIVKLYQELVLGEEIVAEARPLGSMEPSPPLAMLQRQQHPLMKCQSRLLGDPKCIQSTMCGP